MNKSDRIVSRPKTVLVAAACALFSLACAAGAQAEDARQDAALSSVAFRAVGYQPRWVFEEDRQAGIRFKLAGGNTTVQMPTPGLGLNTAPGGVVYGDNSESHALLAEISQTTCHDAVSGERLTHTVTIRLNGREYRGCGKGLRAGETASR